jgi:peptidoglycan/xylan/chitin deacetylase (PgdA/CDA1 family)
MKLKRTVRNGVCSLLAMILILLGYVKNAKKRSFQEDVITSIAFHNPNRKLFQDVVMWFKKNKYVFISTDQLTKVLKKDMMCPRGAVWISLDDGWSENINNVIPIAMKYNIPITIFICTQAVEDGTFWWRKIIQSRKLLPVEYRDVKTIRELPDTIRSQIIDSVAHSSSTFPREAMTVEDIKSVSNIPQVTMGAHTVTHPVLPKCTNEQLEYELAESKRKLEAWTCKPIKAFAYPNGSFDGKERQFLEAYGYELAATTESKFIKADSDCYLVPRNVVMDDGSFTENLCHALGVWEFLIQMLKQVVGKRGLFPLY